MGYLEINLKILRIKVQQILKMSPKITAKMKLAQKKPKIVNAVLAVRF